MPLLSLVFLVTSALAQNDRFEEYCRSLGSRPPRMVPVHSSYGNMMAIVDKRNNIAELQAEALKERLDFKAFQERMKKRKVQLSNDYHGNNYAEAALKICREQPGGTEAVAVTEDSSHGSANAIRKVDYVLPTQNPSPGSGDSKTSQ